MKTISDLFLIFTACIVLAVLLFLRVVSVIGYTFFNVFANFCLYIAEKFVDYEEMATKLYYLIIQAVDAIVMERPK